jgi:hypothetical protein
MPTNADRKLLALGVKSAAFTAMELSKLLEYLIKALKDGLSPAEQKNYADFQHPGGVSLLNVSTEQTEAQGFTDMARQNGVNVSVKRDQIAGTYYLCLQGRREDMIAAVTQYQKRQREQARPRSISAELEQAKLQAASYTATQERKGAQRDSRDP